MPEVHHPSTIVGEALRICGFDKLFEIVEASSQQTESDAHRLRHEPCGDSFTINAN